MNIDALARDIRAGKPVRSLQLSDDHWPELNCEGVSFHGCVFERVQFTDSEFADARFENCRFISGRFASAELPGAEFEDCVFTGENREGCNFAFSNLQRAVFANCDLSLAAFDRTELFAVEMRDCNLTGAKFTKVDFSRVLSRKQIETRAAFWLARWTLPTFPNRDYRDAASQAQGFAKPTCRVPT